MPPSPSSSCPPLTLIVATTPLRPETRTLPTRLGIGLNGTLPWPRIKADMSFFARATARPPRPGTTNAIIMGRKTYDSLPRSLRPLAKRINVVVSRDGSGGVAEGILKELEGRRAKVQQQQQQQQQQQGQVPEGQTDAVVSSGLEEALETLEGRFGAPGTLGHVFVIGGAEIYAAALRMAGSRAVRIVMTNVERLDGGAFECDTVFPVDEELAGQEWRMVSDEEVTRWVGEEVSSEWREEGDVRIQMISYECILLGKDLQSMMDG
ncbi:dihydrofolate reductase [Aspergillus clavatus NRRL 1]|uniref:Dihydrofolate reductase n=1 Tax=Aspergillus clavatus (strain ATCC 1007 / CBS 513.65 / DSM 816 / NCTC 3887 / NRRL 1 / QM 1276 / 107) TaxID=344612 RepID=A1CSV2_ASPCL|nr:dihydrofolate reductase, putative [Aspergillus clavatus NRRL 1]EAW06389.1 dihydrofolate reductase, putative [Aspergillus clavatus NRRL 1]